MKGLKLWGASVMASLICLSFHPTTLEAGVITAGKSHIGTFEGSTTFTTSSSNGINPGLFLEVRDADGQLKQYTSEEGVITVPNTKEGAYVTQAKLLGKTKYVDQDTGETLDTWEEGRNLRLESVQMPVLKATGKNLFDKNKLEEGDFNENGEPSIAIKRCRTADFIQVKSESQITLSKSTTEWFKVFGYDNNKNFVSVIFDRNSSRETFTIPSNVCFIKIKFDYSIDIAIDDNIQLEYDTQATTYEPFKSNILSTPEDLELRGIGDVQDILDCLTGEVAQRVDEIVLDGSDDENWTKRNDGDGNNTITYQIPIDATETYDFILDKFAINQRSVDGVEGYGYANDTNTLFIEINRNRLSDINLNGFKQWLAQNRVTVQYKLKSKVIKTVDLTSTYQFNLVSDGVVQVKGEVIPTIYSVTVPSEPLTFAINPNAEEGQQFIAPDFSITNEGKGPVELELKSFTQKTGVLNDVLPEKYPDWTLLDKRESRDIALALIPKPSDAWLSLTEGPKYVANTSSTIIGKVKPGETVDFSFSAKHGTVFDQNLFPEYQLVFTFGF